MKRMLSLLLFVAAFALPGLQAQEVLPYLQNFDASTSLPSGWTSVGAGALTVQSSSQYAHSGSNSLKFSEASSNVVALPTFNHEINGLEVIFWTRPEGTEFSGSFDVGYLTDATDATTFVTLQTINQSMGVVYQEVAVIVGGAPAGAVLAMRHRPVNQSWFWFVDDVDVHVASSCSPISDLTISNITGDGATASWTPGGSETAWNIELTTNGVTTSYTSNTNSYTFTNLSGNTSYTVTVASNCGTDVGRSVSTSFRTGCGTMALPYIEDFETATVNEMAPCWTAISESGGYPVIVTGSTTSYSMFNPKFLYINGPAIIATPKTSAPLNQLEMGFDYTIQYRLYTNALFIGYTTDLTGPITYVDTFLVPTNYANYSIAHYDFDFSNTGVTDSAYIVIQRGGRTGYLMGIDNFTINRLPTCVRPLSYSTSNRTAHTAVVNWTHAEGITAVDIAYGTGNSPTDASTTLVTNISGNSYTLTGLNSSTEYKVWIRSNCGSETSPWVSIAPFTTECDAIPASEIPYTENFDSYQTGSTSPMIPCWTTFVNGASHYPYITSSNDPHSGAQVLYFNTNTGTYYAALPEFDTAITALQLSFYVRYTTSFPFAVGVMTDPHNLNTFDTLYVGQSSTTWSLVEVPFGGYTGTGRYIAIRSNNNAYIDDVVVDFMPACPRPTRLTLDDVSSTSMTLSWIENGSATSWRVTYSDGTTTNTLNATTHVGYVLSDLTPSTTYTISISPACAGPGDDAAITAEFRTTCAPIATESLPYTVDFESFATNSSGAFDPCWFLYKNGNTHYPYVTTSQHHSGGKSLYFTTNSGLYYVAMPEFEAPINTLQVSLYTKANSAYPFAVGIMTDPYNLGSFDTIYSGTTSANWDLVFLPLGAYTRGGNYIAIRSNNSIYVDDITIELMPPCPQVTGIAIDSVSNQSAWLRWTENGSADSWTVKYFNGSDTVIATADTNSSYEINNLNANTLYTVYIAPVCETGDPIFNSFTFRTGCNETCTFPYFEDFDGVDLDAMVPCWFVIKEKANYPTKVSSGSSFTDFGTRYLHLNYPSIVATPKTEIALNQTEISFDYTLENRAYVDTIYIGYTIDIDTPAVFVDTLFAPDTYQNHSVLHYIGNFANTDVVEPAHVVIKRHGYDNWLLAIDNFAMNEVPDCRRLENATFLGATSNTISLSWSDPNNAGNYDLAYGTVNNPDDESTIIEHNLTDLTYTINNLNASTSYYVWVRANCSNSASPWLAFNVMRTECGDMPIPYVETFEDQPTSQPACWSVPTSSGGSAPYIQDLTSSSGWTGTVNAHAYHLNGTNIVITPKLPLPLNQLDISFLAAREGASSSTLEVGFIPSINTPVESMTLLATLDYASYKQFFEEEFSGGNSTIADTGYLVFKSNGSSSWYWWIDNFTVNTASTCAKPADFTVTQVSSTSITVGWANNDAGSWQVTYSSTTEPDLDNIVTVTTNSCTFNGLTTGNTYNFFVRSACNNGEVSDWRGPLSATAGLFKMRTSGTDTITACGVLVTDDGGPNGNYSNGITLATLVVYPDQPGYGIRFYGNSYTESTFDYLKVYSGVGTNGTLLWVDTTASVPQTIDTIYSEDGPITITFHSDGSSNYDGFALHLECYELPSCPRPIALHTTRNATTAIDIAWNENGTATSWQVAYGSPVADTTNPITVNTMNYSATGLTAGDPYKFTVRSICGEGQYSDWCTPISAVPGTWNMRANQSDTISLCGGVVYDDGGAEGDYTPNQQSYLVLLPEHNGDAVSILGTATIEGSSFDNLYIYDGIGTSGTALVALSGASFTSGTTVSATSTDPSGALTIYFKTDVSGQYDGYELHVSCISTTCPAPTNITATSGTSNVALTWDDANSAIGWQIEYGLTGFNQGHGTMISTSSPFTNVTGLDTLTTYDFYIRQICSVGDTSGWTRFTFATNICNGATNYEVGDNSDYDFKAPHVPYYNYSYVQQIIDSAALVGAGNIAALQFNLQSTAVNRSGITIYMGHTSKTNFANGTDTIAFNTLQRVYSGAFHFVQGWNTLPLDSIFEYNGTDNIVIAIHDSTGSYLSGVNYFGQSTPVAKTLSLYSDNFNPDPSNYLSMASFYRETQTGYNANADTMNFIANLRLVSCGNVCISPVVTSSTTTYNSFIASWNGVSTTYEVCYKTADDTDFTTPVAISGTTYTLTGLTDATSYLFRLRAVCDSETVSDWVTLPFTTDTLPCFAPTALTYSDVDYTSVTLSWTPGGNEQNWVVKVYTSSDSILDTVAATSATIGGLYAGRTYNAAVRAACGSNLDGFSDWSEPISFTTTTCQPVTNVAGTAMPNSSNVQLSWNAGDANQWQIEYGYSGFGQGEGTNVTVTNQPYLVTGLDPETPYDFYVRAVCEEGVFSAWSSVVTVTTNAPDVVCGTVSGVAANVQNNSVTVTWNAADNAESYELEYGNNGFSHGTGTVIDNINGTTYTINSVNAGTYNVYVRANCGNANYGPWSESATFTVTTVGINNADGNANINIYPNPTSGATTISVSGISGLVRVAIVDMNGRVVMNSDMECDGDCVKTMNVENLAQGAYFVRIYGENLNSIRKLVVR